ncbi:Beta-mannosyltransferase 3 [Candida viswanathii]|uniref:Beta-mannosyltransferase 3 n=1 Tax=Candida viswanathii TaxID=5486 RepID=A0A367YKY1_9ASCO|nr:Beta-mannosyltransferase 3 [Candida viswanathii]
MVDSDVLFYFIALLISTPVSLFVSWKYKNKDSKRVATFLRGLFVLLNLNIMFFLIGAVLESSKVHLEETDNFASSMGSRIKSLDYRPMHISGYVFSNKDSDLNFSCDKILYDDDSAIQVSPSIDLNKPNDLKVLRDQLNILRQENPAYNLFFQDDKHEQEKSILEDKWYKFCGSAVWLEKYGVYFMVNRILYTPNKARNHPVISVLSGQVFDKDWQEIMDMKFPFSDLKFPTVLPHYIDMGVKQKKEILGAEDPRIILHEYTNNDGVTIQEPLITFNALSQEVNWKRAMHIYRPLQDPKKIIRLAIEGLVPREKEKNWVPFETKDNHINFIYSFPLRVIKCSLVTGTCQKISGPDFQDESQPNAGELRGGTNLLEIPSRHIPKDLRSRKFWFGIARSHIENCGCVGQLYRPHAIIISRSQDSTGDYSMNFVSNLFDFNINPEPWFPGKSTCEDGKLVLVPNSLTYFKDDYLGVTFSEADKANKLVHTTGWLTYIQKVLKEAKPMLTDRTRDLGADGLLLNQCSTFMSDHYCYASKLSQGWDEVQS